MPLLTALPPQGADRAAAKGFAEIHRTAGTRDGLRGASLDLAAPHPVYTLTWREAAAGRLPTGAKATRWRFLVLDGDRAVAGVEVRIAPDTGEPAFVQTETGSFVTGMVEAIRIAETCPETSDGRLEIRLLRVPPLALEALWLRSLDSETDLFIPLAPAPARFDAFHVYPRAAFLRLLQAEADELPVFDSSPQVVAPVG